MDNKYLLSKSDPNQENYDVIEFAKRNIRHAIIPSFIKIISQRAFDQCQNLRRIEFLKDSQLKRIEKYAFYSTPIECIQFPKNIVEMANNAFSLCPYLKHIDFKKNENITLTIGKNAFHSNNLTSLTIPPQCKSIENDAFIFCQNLEIIEFEHNKSNLISFTKSCFPKTEVKIMVPANLKIHKLISQ